MAVPAKLLRRCSTLIRTLPRSFSSFSGEMGPDFNASFDKAIEDTIFMEGITPVMDGTVVCKRFYDAVTTRMGDDGDGWNVMLDHDSVKTLSKGPLKIQSLALAKVIAAEWEYQRADGIRPFTMPLTQLACTAQETIPLSRGQIIDRLVEIFQRDMAFYLSLPDSALTSGAHEEQTRSFHPLLKWAESEFGFKPIIQPCIDSENQKEGLVKAIHNALTMTGNCELAAIDAITSVTLSVIIPLALFRGRLEIEDVIKMMRPEEELEVNEWGPEEYDSHVESTDFRVQISSAVVFYGLSQRQ